MDVRPRVVKNVRCPVVVLNISNVFFYSGFEASTCSFFDATPRAVYTRDLLNSISLKVTLVLNIVTVSSDFS